ncbi:hypothetical protein C7451_111125 [Blastomonas natatoria]|uniref:Curlin associated repeat-containing protein n=1 Tax=Blastomonas natatoria TaxID=34015 RepID=A0A2V3UUF0_9SPHN|nr:hypothetical protein [Blastomonas natatoria]PXW73003.1 hypothetical protein C7451_111125 [Blastomonas natatoria]
MRTHSARLAIAAMMVLGAQTVQAQTGPVDPCAGATGGSCTTGALSQPIELVRTAPVRNSAFISQIGDGHSASITQSSTRQSASIVQRGDSQSANVSQNGAGSAVLEIDQAGLLNSFVSTQGAADGGGNIAVAAQDGQENAILLDQSATAGSVNTAMLAQQGNGNQMQLGQNGSDNRAELVQLGDNNAMTATQNGSANQLRWVQNGSGLSDLQIVQSGNQAMSITQTNGGS